MDERQRAAWRALELGPLWVPRRPSAFDSNPASSVGAPAPDSNSNPASSVGAPAVDSNANPASRSDAPVPDACVVTAGMSPGEAGQGLPDGPAPEPVLARLQALGEIVAGCPKCRLCESRTHAVFGSGDPQASWMIVGEAPGAEEDARGLPFVGQSGRLLDAMLASIGLDRAQDVYIANVIKCRPPGNRNPQADEVASCEPYLHEQVALVQPTLIVLMGRFAAQSLLRTNASIGALRGRVHRYTAGGRDTPAIVTYHPAYLLRTPADKSKAWQDLCLARAEHARLSGS